ncbi:MAG: dTDP-glucose 4,6-dehydratase [Caldisphaeraceae archaeon]|nr:dTDP-glucose 4,6-dehydratase [Caldisphaeraceae archaeon]
MNYLITGGLGFIGSNFVRYLLSTAKEKDDKIMIVDYGGIGSNELNLKGLEGSYELVKGDIADRRLMERLINSAEVIVNFAAETHVDRSISNPEPFIHSNLIGIYSILEAMRKKKEDEVKLVHISTDEVYGDIRQGVADEGYPLRPSSPYSATKASADMLILSYARTYGINSIILRPSNNYGYYQFPEKLIPKAIIMALGNKKIPLYGGGWQERQWTFVVDTCEAVYSVIKRGKVGEIYNISSDESIRNVDVVKKILKILNKNESLMEVTEDRPGHDTRYRTTSEKIRKEIGWRPRFTFEDGLKLTVKWYMENEWWWKPLINDKVLGKAPWKVDWP